MWVYLSFFLIRCFHFKTKTSTLLQKRNIKLKPSAIYYSQNSINNVFDKRSAFSFKSIGETLDDLCEEREVYSFFKLVFTNCIALRMICNYMIFYAFVSINANNKKSEINKYWIFRFNT